MENIESLSKLIYSYLPQNIVDFLSFSIFNNSILKWIIALLVFTILLSTRKIFVKFVLQPIKIKVEKTDTVLDDKLYKVLEHPLQLLIAIFAYYIAATILSNAELQEVFNNITRTAITLLVFWTIYRSADVYGDILEKKAEKHKEGIGAAITSLLIKIFKIVLIAIALMTVAQQWGFNAMAIFASFGILGAGIALSSQDTIKHFWGSIVLFGDRPFKIGDWITVGSVDGVVEEIGIRSTKIRTFEKSIIAVPNGTLATSNILNWSVRPKRRIKMTLGISYDTTTKQMQSILNDIREYLKNNDDIHPEQILVYFSEFAESSLNILVYCFTKNPSWEPWLKAREEVYLELMKIVENNGSTIAFPSQSVYIEKMPEFSGLKDTLE